MMKYRIIIGANGSMFPMEIETTEEKMREFVWETINSGWMSKNDKEYFFLPANRIDYVTVEEAIEESERRD